MKTINEELADKIVGYIAGCEYPPTFREIGQAIGIPSTATVKLYLDKLRVAGRVRFEKGKVRTVRI